MCYSGQQGQEKILEKGSGPSITILKWLSKSVLQESKILVDSFLTSIGDQLPMRDAQRTGV